MNSARLFRTILFLFILALASAPALAQSPANSADNRVFVEDELLSSLKGRGQANIFVYLRERPDLSPASAMSWDARGRFVHEQLAATAARSQEPVLRELREMGASTRSFWIANVIAIEQGTMPMVEMLAGRNDIAAIISEPIGFIPEPDLVDDDNQLLAPISSIVQIKAPAVWDMGFTGQGITVGIIDSGTRYTHQALVNQYRGNQGGGTFNHNYNWFDIGGSTAPTWPNPHGTHVTGTAIGDDGGTNQVGVAPGAEWVSCLGCTSTSCPGANLLACAEFMAAPTDLAGNNPDPDRRAHVVNNSWGDCGQSYNNWYQGVVDAWIAAGIVPVFANGNAGNCGYSSPPGLNTVGNPARYGNVLGIGSSGNANGQYANHSNWGPTDNANDGTDPALPDPMGFFDLKPNVIAPGVNVFSSVSSSDTAYASTGWTGTSMSAPAAAGLVALMWSAAPALIGDYATTGTLIMQTANPIPFASGGPNPGPGNVPNYASGWGEIDALAAVDAALAFAGPRGTVSGQVTDQDSGLPIEGANVFVENTDPDGAPASWSTTTDASGNYSLTLSEGFRDFEFSAFGYITQTELTVEIIEDQTTSLDAQLIQAASIEITGSVTDSVTGWPLHARLSIDGFPGSPVFTDPADGSYAVTLPSGATYDFDVHVLSGGYVAASRVVDTSAGTDLTENFAIDADLLACSAPGYRDISPVAYFEDFEAGNGGFTETVVAGTPMWQWGTPTTWPGSCVGGNNCWGTNLSGNYPNNSQAYIISPVIDLQSATPPLTLTWDQANHIETFTFDQGLVEVSINGGAWTVIWQNPGSTVQTGWRQLSQDLSNAAGETIQLRWRLTTDGSVNHPGLYVDNLRIQEAPDCVSVPGELVSGRVTDSNTGEALNGAEISVDGVPSGITQTSEDPALGEGAYIVFVGEGNRDMAAAYPDYETAQFNANFVDGQARRVDFALAAGRLMADPVPLTMTVTFGATDDRILDLINVGTADIEVNVEALFVLREDFEASFPPSGWTVENLGGACTWSRNDEVGRTNLAGGDGFSAAADSDACGSGTTMDTALVSSPFRPGVSSTLDFVLSYRHLGSSRLDVDVSTDGGDSWTTIQSYAADQSPQGPGTSVSLPLGAFSGQDIQTRFRYVAPGWDWWAQVDQVEISAPVDWLELTPGNATFGVTTLPVTATFDAGAPSIPGPGEYSANVVIENNSPYGTLVVPVTMFVEPGETQALLTGQVSGLGYCDDSPSPAAGATVEVTGQNGAYTLTTDANGIYQIWLETAEAPLTIEASAAGHLPETANGVALTGQETTEQDFGLRLDAACASASPESFSSSLIQGETESFDLDLINSGAAELVWSTGSALPANVISGLRPTAGHSPAGNPAYTSDLQALYGSELFAGAGQPVPMGTFDCQGAPGLVIHDDGTIENGISGNPAAGVTEVRFVEFYEPAVYPAQIGNVCVSFLTQGSTSLNFDLIIYAADGPSGAPGTELASVPATATGIPVVPPLPEAPAWASVDLSAQNLILESGGVYVGVRFQPQSPNFFLSIDQSTVTPLQTGYSWFDTDAQWATIQSSFANYRALTVRPQMDVAGGCADPDGVSWLEVTPANGTTGPDSSSSLQVVLDSAGLVPGDYEALVCISTTDTVVPIISVPVSLTVGAAQGTGVLEGTIGSLGYCSENPAAAAGASIQIVGQIGTYNVTANSNGVFSIALDMAESPVTVNATAADHLPGSVADIALMDQEVVEMSHDLVLEAACASAAPGSLDAQMAANGIESQVLTLINDGAAAFTWTIEFDEATSSDLFGTIDVVADGGFELGTPNSAWDEASTAFGTPICDVAGCGAGGGTGPNSGSWWTWFGGIAGGDTGSVSQAVTIPVGSAAELRFFLEIPAAAQPGFTNVSLGGDVLFSVTEADAGSYPTYQEVVLDVSQYADGGTYDLVFASQTTSDSAVTNFFIDDVSLVVQPGALVCADPQGVAWVSVDQASGSVDAESSEDVNVIFDSTGLASGTYQASICVATSDSENELIIVPISLEVTDDQVFGDRFEQSGLLGAPRGGDVSRKLPE